MTAIPKTISTGTPPITAAAATKNTTSGGAAAPWPLRRLLLASTLLAWSAAMNAQIIQEDETSLRYRQADGVEVQLRKKPRRTVIVYASLAKVWYAAGGEAVGVPVVKSRTALPEAARDVPTIGRMNMASPEHILQLRPDLVLLSLHLPRHRELAALMRQAGIDALCCNYRNYADFARLLNLFGRLNGHADLAVNQKMLAGIDDLCTKAKTRPPPRVAIIFTANSGFALETPVANTGYMAAMLGARNITQEDTRTKVPFSFERFLLENPDVIVVVPMGDLEALQEKFRQELMLQPAWKTLSAARHGRVHFLPAEWFLFQPGPDYPLALRHLAGLLYPGFD